MLRSKILVHQSIGCLGKFSFSMMPEIANFTRLENEEHEAYTPVGGRIDGALTTIGM